MPLDICIGYNTLPATIYSAFGATMAKFLNTSATNYFLEELIKGAKDRLVLISPFLKLNDRMKELLADKNRLKIDVRVVYGKSELQPEEISWLTDLPYIRTSFCKNLHAKCYMNEETCIITSLNLYEFSQVNNNEMGVLISRSEDADVYREAYEEAQRIIRISEEVRISMERVAQEPDNKSEQEEFVEKLTTSKVAQKLGMKTNELVDRLVSLGLLEVRDGKNYLTAKGKEAGGEFRMSPKFGPYFLWPESLKL
ncbi:phospholipase D family protein [Caldimonas tepidiphila]|uniref:phospholipase D family protein n=1 Tax=Caldimonas tepidiphila TaxID=2315841 RepID=UPI001F0B7FAE|nr:phospholipase D family protein [Caldimonas tepidiphila]